MREDWSLEEVKIAMRVALAPAKIGACTVTSALGVHGAAIRSQWIRRLVIVAGVRSVASRFALAPGPVGACARTSALVIRGAAISTQWVLGLVVVTSGAEDEK